MSQFRSIEELQEAMARRADEWPQDETGFLSRYDDTSLNLYASPSPSEPRWLQYG